MKGKKHKTIEVAWTQGRRECGKMGSLLTYLIDQSGIDGSGIKDRHAVI